MSELVKLTVKDFKATFFNIAAVTDPLEKAKQTAAIESAALVRKVARESMRPKSKKLWPTSSPPGTPPHADIGTIRKLLFFAWDASREAAVIGPAFFPTKSSKAGNEPVPGIHEKAGTLTIVRRIYDQRPKARSAAQAAAFRRKVKAGTLTVEPRFREVTETARYPKRPFMVPALERAKVVMSSFFKNTVTQ
jgi:hypothetical protein